MLSNENFGCSMKQYLCRRTHNNLDKNTQFLSNFTSSKTLDTQRSRKVKCAPWQQLWRRIINLQLHSGFRSTRKVLWGRGATVSGHDCPWVNLGSDFDVSDETMLIFGIPRTTGHSAFLSDVMPDIPLAMNHSPSRVEPASRKLSGGSWTSWGSLAGCFLASPPMQEHTILFN